MGHALSDDPYRHHPNLRGKIADPLTSFHRDLSVEKLEWLVEEHGLESGWWYSDEEREALRAEALDGRWGEDIWVFGYGSLMWDPAIRYAEVRRARIEGYERRFILKDDRGGRGTKENPALFASLDAGHGCDGLAFRIAGAIMAEETEILWKREQVTQGYHARFMPAATRAGDVEVVAFVADHGAEKCVPGLPRETQVDWIAQATGILGSNVSYLRNIVEKLEELNIDDPDMRALLDDVEARMVALGVTHE